MDRPEGHAQLHMPNGASLEDPAGKGGARGSPGKGGKSTAGSKGLASQANGCATLNLPISVSIPGTEVKRGILGQQTVYYVVEAVAFGLPGGAKRTFEEFEALHADLSAKAKFALPPMPPTYWYGNDAPETVDLRRRKLEELLQRVSVLPQVLGDGEEALLRFLGLAKPACAAIRFLASAPKDRGSWLQCLYETTAEPGGFRPLQDLAVEQGLLATARSALAAEAAGAAGNVALKPVDGRRSAEVFHVCELLARAFRCDGEPSSSSQPGTANPRQAAGEVVVRAAHVRVLLDCLRFEGREGDAASRHCVPKAASKALLTLARGAREAWSKTLLAFLDRDGVRQLVDTASSSPAPAGAADVAPAFAEGGSGRVAAVSSTALPPGELRRLGGERLVAELLLRGFDGPVASRFAQDELAAERKSLLNRFFVSEDPFVRVAVGLLLARLVSERDYAEAAQAEVGLQGLYEELRSPQGARLAEADVVSLLLEEEIWTWLCSLAGAGHPATSGFALLVISEIARPSPALVMSTPGLHDSLVERLSARGDVRDPASRVLLAAYHDGAWPASGGATLGDLCAALAGSAEEAQLRSEAHHASLGAASAQALAHCDLVSLGEAAVQTAGQAAAQLQQDILHWTDALRSAAAACQRGHEAHAAAGASMARQLERLRACPGASSGVGGGTGEAAGEQEDFFLLLQHHEAEVAAHEAAIEVGEAQLQALAEARMPLTRELAEQEEAVRRCGGLASAKDGLQQALASAEAARAQVAALDEQMRLASAALPERKAALATAKLQLEAARLRRGDALSAWHAALDAQRVCGAALQRTGEQLQEAHDLLQGERAARRDLRGAAQALARALAALEAQLEELELQEGSEEERRLFG